MSHFRGLWSFNEIFMAIIATYGLDDYEIANLYNRKYNIEKKNTQQE